MNSRQIRELRSKFIRIAMLSICTAMLFIGVTVNITAHVLTRISVDRMLRSLLINAEDLEIREYRSWDGVRISDIFLPQYDRNACYVLNYDENSTLVSIHSNVHGGEDSEDVRACGESLLHSRRSSGQYMNYYFRRAALSDGGTAIALLESSLLISSGLRIIYLTILLGAVGLVITYFLVLHFSDQAIEPEIENAARQKQFITNASHELKTPLAVIRANTEMTELTAGESEWTRSTIAQVDRLNGLIQNLVMITRSQENEERHALSEIDVSKAINETVDPFESLAAQSGCTITRSIAPEILWTADESRVRQLATILIDNAMKYCDEGGTISVSLSKLKGGKGLQFIVSNDYADGRDIDCSRFFDRFYREDESHNIDKGGYGIGLSIAESICRQYGGSIKADWKDGVIRFICVLK